MSDEETANNADGVVTNPEGYAANRAILREISEKLRRENDIDLDELIPLIDQASAAYKVCRSRIETVEKLLEERLPQDSIPEA